MSKELSLRERTPHKVGNYWWYEETWGIAAYIPKPGGVIKIMWRNLKPALKRAELRKKESRP